jgi:hypothetical protein
LLYYIQIKEREVKTMRDFSTIMAMTMTIVGFIFKVACIGVLVWTMVSLVDVSIHNFTMIYTYADWNLFEFLFHVNK